MLRYEGKVKKTIRGQCSIDTRKPADKVSFKGFDYSNFTSYTCGNSYFAIRYMWSWRVIVMIH